MNLGPRRCQSAEDFGRFHEPTRTRCASLAAAPSGSVQLQHRRAAPGRSGGMQQAAVQP
jgi:hypothetical protein